MESSLGGYYTMAAYTVRNTLSDSASLASLATSKKGKFQKRSMGWNVAHVYSKHQCSNTHIQPKRGLLDLVPGNQKKITRGISSSDNNDTILAEKDQHARVWSRQ
jgi:hypothetical protein